MSTLTHLDEHGAARMVDVGAKVSTLREATAHGRIAMSSSAIAALGGGSKGDALAVARIAGIMAAKRTSELIPLCHPLALTAVSVDFALDGGGVTATARARSEGQTGVEMEALTAVSIALLTIYDMVKSTGHTMEIGAIALIAKRGGKSGDWSKA